MPSESEYGYKTIETNKVTVFADAGRGDANDPSLDGLIRSIEAVGLLHPITVYPDGDHWFCMAGARRLAAVRALGWTHVTAQVREQPDNQGTVAVAALENLDRKDLSPIDEATMCSAALQVLGDIDLVAKSIHRSPNWIQSRLDILGWPGDCLAALQASALSMSAIGPLAAIDNEHVRDYYLTEAVGNGATARQTASWAAAWRQSGAQDLGAQPSADSESPVPSVPVCPPTGYCLVCRGQHNLNELSHLPLCVDCLDTLRQAAMQTEENDARIRSKSPKPQEP